MNFKLKLKEIDFPMRMNFDVVKLEDGQVFLRLKIEEIRVV